MKKLILIAVFNILLCLSSNSQVVTENVNFDMYQSPSNNDFVNNYIKPYLAKGSSLLSLFIYAVIITVIAVTVTYQLTKIIEKLEGGKN